MPLISVIVPVFRAEKLLQRCVDSILNQTFSDFELLLVDDGSPDNSGIICETYAANDNRIKVFHQPNKGQAAARNLALDWIYKYSSSMYVAFVDSDDWVHPNYLELLLKAIKRYNTSISQCGYIEVGEHVVEQSVKSEIKCITVEEEYIHYYSAFIWGKLFSRNCFSKIRFPEGQIYEDVAIWYKILFSVEKIAFVQATLYYYYKNTNSTVRVDWTPKRLFQISVWDEQLSFALQNLNESLVQTVLARYLWVLRTQFFDINKSCAITLLDRWKYQWIVKNRAKKIVRKYKGQLKEYGIYYYYESWLYPVRNNAYWVLIGKIHKVRSLFLPKKE